MQKPMHDQNYKGMSLMLKFRDAFIPPRKILNDVEISPRMNILDYGCGPGSYSIAVAEILAETGKIYALDAHHLAIETVRQTALQRGLKNVETILTDCETGLPENSIDIVLMYYVFHDLKNQNLVLKELHRVLKQDGIISFRDYNRGKFTKKIESTNLFKIKKIGKKMISFEKNTEF